MPLVPLATDLDKMLTASKCFLESSTTTAEGSVYTQLTAWSMRGTHNESVSPFLAGRAVRLLARRPSSFDFTCRGLDARSTPTSARGSRLARRSTRASRCTRWRIKYYTADDADDEKFVQFTGKMKAFSMTRDGSGSGRLGPTMSGTVRLQDANGLAISPSASSGTRA